jgi:hypothetical protein
MSRDLTSFVGTENVAASSEVNPNSSKSKKQTKLSDFIVVGFHMSNHSRPAPLSSSSTYLPEERQKLDRPRKRFPDENTTTTDDDIQILEGIQGNSDSQPGNRVAYSVVQKVQNSKFPTESVSDCLSIWCCPLVVVLSLEFSMTDLSNCSFIFSLGKNT